MRAWRRKGLRWLWVMALSVPAWAADRDHDWFGNREHVRQLRQEESRRIDRMLDATYGPNPRSEPMNLQPLANSLHGLFETIAEGRRQRAQEQAFRAQYVVELLRLQRQRAEEEAKVAAEEAKKAQFERWHRDWEELKAKALAGDRQAAEWVARLTRHGSPRLPKLRDTGEQAARPWLELASNLGSAEAAFELGLQLRESDPREALRRFTLAAERGRLEAVPLAAGLAADGVPGLAADPAEALRLYRIGIARRHKPSMISAGWSVLADPASAPEVRREAVRWLTEAGPDPMADSILAQVFWHGRGGIGRDRRHAVLLAQRAHAVRPQSAGANEVLGLWLAESEGLDDRRQSVGHLRIAAEAGSVAACRQLAYAFANGADGAEKNGAEALKWLRKGGQLGDADCSLVLARNLRAASPRDVEGAVAAYSDASRNGNAEAAHELALLWHTGRDGFGRRPADSHAQAMRAAKAGNRDGMELVAWQFLEGSGCGRDPVQAAEWMRRAAEAGSPSAQHAMGLMNLDGIGVTADASAARSWTAKAAEQGHAGASAQLAYLLVTGTGGPADAAAARAWALKSAQGGHVAGQRTLGVMLLFGEGGAKDEAGAVPWLEKAAKESDPTAAYLLGTLLRDGKGGLAKDVVRARALFELAVKEGDPGIATDAREALSGLPTAGSLESLRIKPGKPAPSSTRRLDGLKIP